MNDEMPPYDSRDIYLTNGTEIIGLHEIGEANSSWIVKHLDGTEEQKFGFSAYERWGNEYNNDLKMIGRGSFRVHIDIEEVAKDFETDGWTRFIPEIKG